MCKPSKVEEKKTLSRNSNKLSILGSKGTKVVAGDEAGEAERRSGGLCKEGKIA